MAPRSAGSAGDILPRYALANRDDDLPCRAYHLFPSMCSPHIDGLYHTSADSSIRQHCRFSGGDAQRARERLPDKHRGPHPMVRASTRRKEMPTRLCAPILITHTRPRGYGIRSVETGNHASASASAWRASCNCARIGMCCGHFSSHSPHSMHSSTPWPDFAMEE